MIQKILTMRHNGIYNPENHVILAGLLDSIIEKLPHLGVFKG